MEQRVVLFLVLSLIIIFGWNYLLEKMGLIPEPPAEEQVVKSDKSVATEPGTVPELRESQEQVSSLVGSSTEASSEAVQPFGAAAEERVKVETDLYRVELSNRGAVIKSWELKRYTTNTADGPAPVQLMYAEGRFRGPLNVTVSDEAVSRQLTDGLYHVDRDFSRLDADRPTGLVTFTYRDPENGLLVEKRLTFHYDSYLVDVAVRTEGLGDRFDVGLGTNFGVVEWGQGFIGLVGPASFVNGELVKDTPDQEDIRKGAVRWVAMQDKYFISVFLPRDAEAALTYKEMDQVVAAGVRFGGRRSADLQLYAGPKEYDTLKALDVGLEDTIDFGWFIYGSWDIVRALAKPLFYVLRFFHQYTHNYGLAIILVTVCVKLLFVPLQYKSYKSMKDMQAVQPKVVELQKKYKDDREQLNKELIKLYRDYKVNPVGGCLPMLLQMPVFIALFNILYMTIDLRQAPFFLWISDLSVPDPFWVLPILMGLSMVLQQKIMPTTMDPAQARMMLLLPIFLTFIFLNFASGLVLYWFTNNVLTIAQQFITDRYIFKKPLFSSLTGTGAETSAGAKETKAEGDATRKEERTSGASGDPQPAQAVVPKGGGKRRKKKRRGGAQTVAGDGQTSTVDHAESQPAEASVEESNRSSMEGDGAGSRAPTTSMAAPSVSASPADGRAEEDAVGTDAAGTSDVSSSDGESEPGGGREDGPKGAREDEGKRALET